MLMHMDIRETDDAIEAATHHAERAERDLRDALDAERATLDWEAERVERAADDLHTLAAGAADAQASASGRSATLRSEPARPPVHERPRP